MASKKVTPPGEYATDSEVEAAIRALSDTDAVRLGRFATFRARGLAGRGLGLNGDDLLQEAIKRTLDGDRHWRKTVTFVKHLIETMRSIASHAAEAEDPKRGLDGVELRSQLPDGERVAAAAEQFRKIGEKFDGDDEVGLLLEGLKTGMTGPEIQRDLNLTETEFETIMIRLRRGVDRREGWRP